MCSVGVSCASDRDAADSLEYFAYVALHFYLVPDLLDLSIDPDQERTAHDSFEDSAHELLRPPHAIGFDHFASRIADQSEIKFLLLPEFRQIFFRVGARANDGYVLLVETSFCVTKLGRFGRSTGSIGFGKEKQHHPFSLKIGQRHLRTGIVTQCKVWCFVSNFQHLSSLQPASSFLSISFTACGLACPRVALITCPTKNLNTPSLPDLNFATFSGFFSITSRAICSSESLLT